MNQRELIRVRNENFKKLDTAFRPKINTVEVDINNSIDHELAKFFCVVFIRNGILAESLPEIFEEGWEEGILTYDDSDFQIFKHEWERPQVITEARFKRMPFVDTEIKVTRWKSPLKFKMKPIQRRADIFILDTGEIVEIETDKKVNKEGAITVYV